MLEAFFRHPPQVGERKEKEKNQLLLLLKHVALLWFSINTALNILGRSARRLGDSPVCVFMCSSKYCFMLKSFPHHWHMNCLCPMWMLMWERSWYLYWKRSLQFWNIKNKTKKNTQVNLSCDKCILNLSCARLCFCKTYCDSNKIKCIYLSSFGLLSFLAEGKIRRLILLPTLWRIQDSKWWMSQLE